MSEIKIEVSDDAEGETIEEEAVEVIAEAEVEAVEEVTDAAVQIAQIEADAEIALAIIEGENQVAVMEAAQTGDNDKWQILQDQVANLSEQVAALTASLTPPLSIMVEEVSPPNPSPESASLEVMPESLEAQVAQEPPKRKPKSRWI